MTASDRIARLRIQIDGIEPAIWRQIEVPLTTSLKGLHDAVQAVMGSQGSHLYEFEVGDKRYGIPDPEWEGMRPILNAKSARLAALIERDVRAFTYVYDFGDDWRHTIVVEAVADADPRAAYPRFLDGARRGPPEDFGSTEGYYQFLNTVTKPRHRERRQMLEWYGGPYDPDDINLQMITARLSQLARHRTIGRAAYAKSKSQRH